MLVAASQSARASQNLAQRPFTLISSQLLYLLNNTDLEGCSSDVFSEEWYLKMS